MAIIEEPQDEVISSIKQKKLFHHIEWKLYPEKVVYSNKRIFHSLEREIPFEELTNKKIFERTNNISATVLAVALSVIFIGKTISIFFYETQPEFGWYAVLLAITFILTLVAYSNSSNFVLIEASIPNFLFLYINKPNENVVEEFLKKYKEAGKNYFIKKYIENHDITDLNLKCNWVEVMKSMQFIGFNDAAKLINKIKEPNTRNPIGFK